MAYLLTLVTFLPVVVAALVLLLPRRQDHVTKLVTLGATLVTFVVSLPLYFHFDPTSADYQFVEQKAWIPSLGVTYHLGVDGISVLLVLLTTFLMPLVILSSWTSIESRWKEFAVTMLLLETGMIGVFVSLDLFLFYVFWEAMLIPMYLIIGIWGGQNRIYAAIKFILYTLGGSLLMLVAILVLYFQHGAATNVYTFDLPVLARYVLPGGRMQDLLFFAFALAFAIKVPMFPFHTWLPDAHVEAPTAGSVILAGVLLKMGTYGFVRISLPMLPDVFRTYAPVVAVLALLGIVYGALVALAQTDLKKLVAYSSVNHMGYVMLGVAAAAAAFGVPEKAAAAATALNGAVFEMVAHGIITGALFLIVGVLYDYRAHTRGVDEFGGLGARLPIYTGITTIAMLASLGLPGLMGFVAEFFIFVGSFGIFPYLTAIAVTGVVFTAAMFLWTIQRIFLGPVNERWAALPDMDTREKVSLVPLAVLMVVFGLFPKPLLDVINAAMAVLVTAVR